MLEGKNVCFMPEGGGYLVRIHKKNSPPRVSNGPPLRAIDLTGIGRISLGASLGGRPRDGNVSVYQRGNCLEYVTSESQEHTNIRSV